MCGIVGIYHRNIFKEIAPDILEKMRDTMVHRGPDGGGLWLSPDRKVGLGHRRLAIIDPQASADQPMQSRDQRLCLVFNGEIYNHLPLRRALENLGHTFQTDHSDTEVLLHGYRQWGLHGLLERLEGMFAFALWDQERSCLMLARDRIGIKPLYFAEVDGAFLFASEIKALHQHPRLNRDINQAAFGHYLSFLSTAQPMTLFDGVWKLPSGTCVEITAAAKPRAHRYWAPEPGHGIDPDQLTGLSPQQREEFYISGIRTRLEAAVEKRMMSDVPSGVFLSGGVDSSTNVALMSKFSPEKLRTFTVGFKDHQHLNELDHARLVADHFNCDHHEILIDERDMRDHLDQIVFHQDEPIADWVCIPLYFIAKLAHDSGVKMVQVGEGADEQFCGYTSYLKYLDIYRRLWAPAEKYVPNPLLRLGSVAANFVADRLRRFDIQADMASRLAANRELFWSGAHALPERQKHSLFPMHPRPLTPCPIDDLLPDQLNHPDGFAIINDHLSSFDRAFPKADQLTRMIHLEFRQRLPELLLMRVDKMTMAHSLEARVPFLDHKLVEFSMDIPMADKIKGGRSKHLLKEAVRGLIPDQIIDRPKMGFGAPMSAWLKGDFGRDAESEILGSELCQRLELNLETIKTMFSQHRQGKRDTSLALWTILNAVKWWKR